MKVACRILLSVVMLSVAHSLHGVTNYREKFLNPDDENKSIIIWQWMDGLISQEAITKDLEAFKQAGLSGVQNFQIGGDPQIRVGNPDYAIGSSKWKDMIRWTLHECKRLGLTFGTHNCPGWSSSAFSNVTPEYAMQKLVYTDTVISAEAFKRLKKHNLKLERPEVDPKYNYYEDIAILAFPNDSIISKQSIIDLTEYYDGSKLTGLNDIDTNVRDEMVIMRIGHTTNGKTNASQAPVSGQGLECDKMRREAVKSFWNGYPQMLIDIAGNMAGSVFNRIEIDSYEAGGQNWSVVLPEEFQARKKYDIIPYLPSIVEKVIIDGKDEHKRFMKDLVDVVTSLFAENYYGYLNELASQTPGMKLLIEPYGTGGQKPFPVIDIYKILDKTPDAIVATEFWVKPNWGWKDMCRHEKVIRQLNRNSLYAEGFTCWPLHAWKDDPHSLKPICDRAYCSGVNRMMLHAGAVNPWPNVEPGMSFGIWGTQFVPTQTWWKAGGAKALFDYMARCQSLLQRGNPASNQYQLTSVFPSYHRVDGENDIIFVCNPTDTTTVADINLTQLAHGRNMELWNPYSLDMTLLSNPHFNLSIEPNGSRFIIISSSLDPVDSQTSLREQTLINSCDTIHNKTMTLANEWILKFGNQDELQLKTLQDWTTFDNHSLKYYSGTATYINEFTIEEKPTHRVILDLGTVKNMASVRLNGIQFPVMWKSPFLLDVTEVINPGNNIIEIDITNLWVNRMVGDEQEPDDIKWTEPLEYTFAPGSPVAGRYMSEIPSWLNDGTDRPSINRKTVVGFKFFNADSPLLPSGLLGPVKLIITNY